MSDHDSISPIDNHDDLHADRQGQSGEGNETVGLVGPNAFLPMRKDSEPSWVVTAVIEPLRLMLRDPRAMHFHL